MKKTTTGFTLVELLIVIVVIAILAAISIVAYTGVQNRANDSAVKSDLSNFARQIQMKHAEDGVYPRGGSATGNSANIPGFSFRPTKGSYWTSSHTNLYYCEGRLDDRSAFRVEARSKSGQTFRYTSNEGLTTVSHTVLGSAVSCQNFETGFSWGYGFWYNNGNPTWWNWTNG